MPARSRSAKIYNIAATLSLSIAMTSLEAIRELHPTADFCDLMICFSVVIGFFDQRPMNHSKLALFLGIPRPTVVRRVKRLVASQVLEFSDDGKAILTPRNRLVGECPSRVANRFAQLVQNAAGELNKMDTA